MRPARFDKVVLDDETRRLADLALRGDPLGEAVIQEIERGEPGSSRRAIASAIKQGDPAYTPLSPAAREFVALFCSTPQWVDWSRVVRGSDYYWSAGRTLITLALGLGSLVDNYVSQTFSQVLAHTGELCVMAPKRLDRTYEWLTSATHPSGMRPMAEGRVATAMVRLAHCRVRLHIEKRGWEDTVWGRAVSQLEGLHGTLVFSYVMFDSLHRLGASLNGDEEDGYHLWKVIQHYMGIDPAVAPENGEQARRQLAFVHATNGLITEDARALTKALIDVYRSRLEDTQPNLSASQRNRLIDTIVEALQGRDRARQLEVRHHHLAPELRLMRRRNRHVSTDISARPDFTDA